MGMVADQRRLDPKVAQEFLGVPGVLRGDEFHFFQYPQSPQGDILQIADGGGDDKEGAHSAHPKTRPE
jgi:hypothetical protein